MAINLIRTTLRARVPWRMTAVGAVVLFLGAACGGSGPSDDGVASADGDAASAEDGGDDAEDVTEAEMIDYTECLREQGVDARDPVVDAEGNVSFGGVVVTGGEETGSMEDVRADVQAAMEVCGEPPGGGFSDQEDKTEMQDQVLEMVECVRDRGFDMPDPNFDGGGVTMEADGNLDPNDPAFQEAMQECSEEAGVPTGGMSR